MNQKSIYLFSIDLEDIRLRLDHPENYSERVPINTYKYLDWLRNNNSKCTFFVTGDMAALYPSLINEIMSEEHEIACHTYAHIPIEKQTKSEFRDDLDKNIRALQKAGVKDIKGFRAPVFSLTKETQWTYEILADLGFSYSSSVLPARNPLYGWSDFGFEPKLMNDSILEIPITTSKFGPLTLPVFGGVYFRALPFFLIKNAQKRYQQQQTTTVGYFHPYDIDTEQERYMNPGINNSRLYNFLMYYNRNKVFHRLDKILKDGFKICTYADFVKMYNNEDHELSDKKV